MLSFAPEIIVLTVLIIFLFLVESSAEEEVQMEVQEAVDRNEIMHYRIQIRELVLEEVPLARHQAEQLAQFDQIIIQMINPQERSRGAAAAA